MKRVVLITGGLGYIGSQLIRDAMLSAPPDLQLRVVDNFHRECWQALAQLPPGKELQFLEGDILDPLAMRRALEGVHSVIHLAALVRTPFSFDHPEWTQQVNHWGTARLVEICLEMGIARLVFASSASVYGSGGPYAETDSPQALGPYSQAKLEAEKIVEFARGRGLPGCILRLSTVYGWAPAMRFDAMPNRLAFLAATGRSLVLHGGGDQIRPILHVRDASSALLWALEADVATDGLFNVVAENVSVSEVVAVLRDLRPQVKLRHSGQDALTRISTSVSSDRLLAAGWRPGVGLADGLREILNRFSGISSPATDWPAAN